MVRTHKKAYQTFTRHEKTKLAETLVKQWQAQNPPGRFLEKDDTTGYWFCIGEKSARRKTSQLLREGAAKIRRELKTESDMKKKRAKTPLPALVPLSQATENSAERPSYKKSQAVTPAIIGKPSGENALVPSLQGSGGDNNNSYNNFSTPLRQITPAQANRAMTPHATPYPYYRYPSPQYTWHHQTPAPYYSPVSVTAANRPVFTFGAPVPFPTKTPVTKREGSTTSVNQITPDNDNSQPEGNLLTSALTTSPDPSSDESPLELELSTFQASWDFEGDILENCGDISSIVDDIEKDEHTTSKMVDDLPEQGPSHPGVTSLELKTACPEHPQKTLFHPSPTRARLIRQLSPPQLSPSSITKIDPDLTKAGEQPMHLYDSTWGSFSFNSVDSLDATSPDSFDMDGIVSPDSHSIDGDGGLPSAVEILNELDKDLEAEFLLPLSASY